MDRSHVLHLLRRSKSDIWAQASLRKLIADRTSPAALTLLTDDEVLETVADLVASGELALLRTSNVTAGRTGLPAVRKSDPAPPPVRRVPPASTAPAAPQDPPIFPANTDPAAQAAAMQQAAQDGAPFCLQ